eukprot:CAMPEP_0194242066 /NCGR_PEP_ID=MMETSP0158-20130606/7711_1 /TAXON_ID=33649 /ORGANISM="Thalassionema nitzschioides, Strain L26-B" /LENGTH=804 /DNA_ID=CAMNT_0038977085 /DNA_START=68 /DNA_END=2479 /DNA_ORIENTATION=+
MALFIISAIALCLGLASADKLDNILISHSGIFDPDSASLCPASSSTTFSSVFTSTDATSNWSDTKIQYEENAFEIQIDHTDDLPERSWSLRLGKGGQVMSLILKPGESIANQDVPEAIWNDLVQQMIAVDETGLHDGEGYPSFIHGSGPYSYEAEGTKPPFYNPKLAMNCDGNDCTMINWGQQAHVPTKWDAPLLYYTRYRDCGDGVIQYDMAMYHFGQDGSRDFSYFNTPWTGVRTSTFRDLMTSNTDGSLNFAYLNNFINGAGVKNLEDTAGFTTFAEAVTTTYSYPFCVDSTDASNWYYCDDANAPNALVPFSFKPTTTKVEPTGHWETYGLAEDSTVRMNWCSLSSSMPLGAAGWGKYGTSVIITNDDTGFSFESDYIIHYCYDGAWTYMSASEPSYKIAQQFPVGASISVAYKGDEAPWNAQNGLTFVHGKGAEFDSDTAWHRARSRIRYGITTEVDRDGTVFTTNLIGRLMPGEVYSSRKFMITDLLSEMETRAGALASSDEAYEDVSEAGSNGNGEVIKLWKAGSSFGASVGSESCLADSADEICSGFSAPSASRRPLFYIKCGTNTIVSHDPYTDPYSGIVPPDYLKRPYKCQLNAADIARTGRAEWKLLGFFPDVACWDLEMQYLEYSSEFCEGSFLPTPRADLTQGGIATQDCTIHGGVASRAIDGNTDGYWWSGSSVTHTCGGANTWWQVVLENEAVVSQVDVFNRLDAHSQMLGGATVELLRYEGTDLVLVASHSLPSATTNIHEFNVYFDNVQAHAVRVTHATHSYPLQLAEVVVKGSFLPTPRADLTQGG